MSMKKMHAALVISAIDKMTAPMRRMASSSARLNNQIKANNRALRANQANMLGAVGAGYALARSLAAPINAARDFQAQMGNVATLIDTSVESMADKSRAVLDISKRIPVATNQLTSGLYQLRSAGVSAADEMKMLESSGKLAVAGLGTTEQSVDLATSAIKAFGLVGKGKEQVFDKIFKTVKNGKTTISGLSQGFGNVATTVAEAGVSFEGYLSSVAALTSVGAPASQAHTQMRAAITALQKPTEKTKKLFNHLGVKTFEELIDKSGDVGTAFKYILKASKGNAEYLTKMLGSAEAYNAVITVGGKANENYASTLEQMNDGTNAMAEAFEKQASKSNAKLQVMQNRGHALGIAIGNSLLPPLDGLMDALTPIIEAMTSMAAKFPKLTSGVVLTASGLVGLRVASIGAGFAFNFMKGGVLGSLKSFKEMPKQIGKTILKMRALTLMMASPIGVAVGLTAIGLGAVHATGSIGGLNTELADNTAAQHAEAYAKAGEQLFGLARAADEAHKKVSNLHLLRLQTETAGHKQTAASMVESLKAELKDATAFQAGDLLEGVYGGVSQLVGIDYGGADDFGFSIIGKMKDALDNYEKNGSLRDLAKALENARGHITRNGALDLNPDTESFKYAKQQLDLINQYAHQVQAIQTERNLAHEKSAQIKTLKVDGKNNSSVPMPTARKPDLEPAKQSASNIDQSMKQAETAAHNISASMQQAAAISVSYSQPLYGSAMTEERRHLQGYHSIPIDGQRAKGGSVAGGKSYLVGEQGPEVITPSRSGYVHDNKSTASMQGGAPVINITVGEIVVQGVQDPMAIAEAIGDELKRQMSGLHADPSGVGWGV